MTKEELNFELEQLRLKYEKVRRSVIIKYCDSNNPYNVGDKFTDHIGTIKIEEIKYNLNISDACCVYFGAELKKDGTPFKNGSKRRAWQSNDIK